MHSKLLIQFRPSISTILGIQVICFGQSPLHACCFLQGHTHGYCISTIPVSLLQLRLLYIFTYMLSFGEIENNILLAGLGSKLEQCPQKRPGFFSFSPACMQNQYHKIGLLLSIFISGSSLVLLTHNFICFLCLPAWLLGNIFQSSCLGVQESTSVAFEFGFWIF